MTSQKDDLEKLLDDLTKPMFVWRMNRAQQQPHLTGEEAKHPKVRAARTATAKSLEQVHQLVMDYATRHKAPGVGVVLTVNPARPHELRTPQEWADASGVEILDPDGWREDDAPSFDEPITHDHYLQRVARCTIRVKEERRDQTAVG